jgi:hypothetical protein
MSAQSTIPIETVWKAAEAICFTIGPAVTAYFVFGFAVDQYGYYYRDTELGIAVGVFLIALGFAVRRWRA